MACIVFTLSKLTVLMTANTSCPSLRPSAWVDCRVSLETIAWPLQSIFTSTSGPRSDDIPAIFPQNIERAQSVRSLRGDHHVARADTQTHGDTSCGIDQRNPYLAGGRGEHRHA